MSEHLDTYAPGTPCWVDLMADDQQAALDYYSDLLGWHGERGPEEFGGYAVCALNDRAVAGIGPKMAMEGAPPPPTVWTTYLATADIEATARAISANGGTLLFEPMTVGQLGRMLVAIDPTGAAFGCWQAIEFTGAQRVNENGALTWNELNTTDVAAATAFYGAVFGIEGSHMPEMPDYTILNVGGRPVGGLQKMPEGVPAGTPSHWMTYFAVDDTDAVVDAAVRAKSTLLMPATDLPPGRMAVLQDPQGAVFSVIKSAM